MIVQRARNKNGDVGEANPQAAAPDGTPPRTEADNSTSGKIFHYDYYPEAEVYFDINRHLYFYRKDREWTMSVALPTIFQESIGRAVRIEMGIATPYERHRTHRERYPPREMTRF